MALISDDTIQEVKRSVDIIEIVSSYFPLKRAGANYKAVCPFHDEKTPSFNVHPEKQIFKCFGCGKAGDAISFVMEHDKLEYPDAIRHLAERAGIPVRYQEGAGPRGPSREDLLRANEWAATVFRRQLLKDPSAEAARQFLARRGVNDETSERFGLGYALDSWDGLLKKGARAGFPESLLAAAGLVRPRGEGKRGHYDTFRGRVTFPIHDRRGKVAAFGARTLKDEGPKFINSPETAVFSKGRGFYGLRFARETLEETRTVYIVEGYMDVIIPHQAGVRGIVATLGTALTKEHLKVLRHYADKVVLVFDSDAAGAKASERGLDLLLTENVDIFVASLPPGMDPDDVVMKEGPDRLRACLERPREIFDFLMASLTAKHGGETPSAIQRVVEETLDRIARIPNEIKREILVQQLAERFGLEERTLRGRVARLTEGGRTPVPVKPAVPVPPAAIRIARDLLALMMGSAATAARVREQFPLEGWPEGRLRSVAAAAYALLDAGEGLTPDVLMARLSDRAESQMVADIGFQEVDPATADARADGCVDRLQGFVSKSESRERMERLKHASTPEEQDRLLRETLAARKKRPQDRGRMPGR